MALLCTFPGKTPLTRVRFESNHNTSGRAQSQKLQPNPLQSNSQSPEEVRTICNRFQQREDPCCETVLTITFLSSILLLGNMHGSFLDSSFFYDFMASQLAQTDACTRPYPSQRQREREYPKVIKSFSKRDSKSDRSQKLYTFCHRSTTCAVCFLRFLLPGQHPASKDCIIKRYCSLSANSSVFASQREFFVRSRKNPELGLLGDPS